MMDTVATEPAALGAMAQKRRGKNGWRAVPYGFALFLAVALGFLYYIGWFTGNVRTVAPDRVYRSAQLSPGHLREVLKQHGIRTVINLRGGDSSSKWFRDEKQTCDENGARYEVLSMRASALPRPRDLDRLLEIFDRDPYPVIFHCQGGADRSGLTAALYLNLYEHQPLAQALDNGLTWRYGHFQLQAKPMDEFFALYRKTGEGMDLRTWIKTKYPDLYREQKRKKDKG